MILNDELRHYAKLLSNRGFTIHEPTSMHDNEFGYSQMVGGRKCFGSVMQTRDGSFKHLMPITPSQENGSWMFVDGVPDALTVEAARTVAQPTNWNKLVGTQENCEYVHWLTLWADEAESM